MLRKSLAGLAALVILFACGGTSPTAPSGPTAASVAVQPGDLPSGMQKCDLSGDINSFLTKSKAKDPSTYTTTKNEWDAAQKQGEQLAAVSLEFTRKAGENDQLFGSVTSLDVAEALAGKGVEIDRKPLLILGTATIEEHGAHLPTGTDLFITQRFMDDFAARLDAKGTVPFLTLPAIWTGYSAREMQRWPGTIRITGTGPEGTVSRNRDSSRAGRWIEFS